ncbi:MAG: PQQ-dependent sugar dehydrogenase [Planctomycetia bacterium]
MKRVMYLAVALTAAAVGPNALLAAEAAPRKELASGLKAPESVAMGADGKAYVSIIGEFDKAGDGSIVRIEDGKAVPYATGLDDPKGLAFAGKFLYVTDKNRIVRIDGEGKTSVFVAAEAFPNPPLFLNDLVAEPADGTLYVSDSGDLKGAKGAVYRISPKGEVTTLIDQTKVPELNAPNGLLMDGQFFLLMGDFGTGNLYRVALADGKTTKIAEGMGSIDGVVNDHFGRLYVSDWKGGKVFVIGRPEMKPILLAEGMKSSADFCYDFAANALIVPDMMAGTVVSIPATVPGYEVDQTPLPLKPTVAFPDLEWTGWSPETADGKPFQFRPILLTHAGDGSNRVFVASQQGVVHAFPNDPKVKKTEIFVDLQDRVAYDDKTNEEGFLGLAFHPKFKENGEFYVFYTTKTAKLTNVVSRFRTMKGDATKGNPASEEVLLRIEKPFWNHDGGTVAFGPDGMLYITHGDGGKADDPFDNGQKMSTPLGKVLRIDVDGRDKGKAYAVPKDNPFVGSNEKADVMPEIWAYGFRNIWRFAFDSKTGDLWAGDVGQNLWEEIDLVTKGGNYGWARREGMHPFGKNGVGATAGLVDPVWEYHHDIGKSITGGAVYRGDRLPELHGSYVYADYVSGRVWAMTYDAAAKRATANRLLVEKGQPIYSFGEDEKGELYFLTSTLNGKGVFRFEK